VWNVIEHIFGVIKQHFHILLLAPKYSIKIQAQIPSTLCAIHNCRDRPIDHKDKGEMMAQQRLQVKNSDGKS
jgi:hypothetical protein